MKKISDFLRMIGAIYFKSCHICICWHLHSEFGLAQIRDKEATSMIYSHTLFFVVIYSCCVHTPHFLGTAMCLDSYCTYFVLYGQYSAQK